MACPSWRTKNLKFNNALSQCIKNHPISAQIFENLLKVALLSTAFGAENEFQGIVEKNGGDTTGNQPTPTENYLPVIRRRRYSDYPGLPELFEEMVYKSTPLRKNGGEYLISNQDGQFDDPWYIYQGFADAMLDGLASPVLNMPTKIYSDRIDNQRRVQKLSPSRLLPSPNPWRHFAIILAKLYKAKGRKCFDKEIQLEFDYIIDDMEHLMERERKLAGLALTTSGMNFAWVS